MISSNTYEEVYEVLSYMDKITVMKIPDFILKKIKDNRNVDYKTKINKNDIFNEQNLFKNKQPIVKNQSTTTTSIVEYNEKNFLQKIFDKIKRIFKRNT